MLLSLPKARLITFFKTRFIKFQNEQFLPFPQYFIPFWRTFPHFHQIKKLSSTNLFSLEESKICRLGKC